MNQKIAVLGAGSWGTALAVSLGKNGNKVNLWGPGKEHVEAMREKRENEKYLPGVKFPYSLSLMCDPEEALKGAGIVLFAAPAQKFRSALDTALPHLNKETVLVNVAKGIEQKSLLRLSEIAEEKVPECRYVVLSGPSHAEEMAQGMPTTLVSASTDKQLAEYVQDVFMSEELRIYTNTDVAGVELGGALKNIIALGGGISDGMGFGDNAKAAMMTRGMTEISRLGVRLGASEKTFAGLSGMGDLIATCTSMHSRNRRCGIMIGQGVKPEDATQRIGMVVEGMFTTEAAFDLAQKSGVEMPITEAIYHVLHDKVDAREAVLGLMTRDKKHEEEAAMLKQID